LEGYVRLGFRKEMEAIADPIEREKYYKAKVAELYADGKAVSIASVLEIDEVIDPAETRRWIMAGLRSVPKSEPRVTANAPASMPGRITKYREHCDLRNNRVPGSKQRRRRRCPMAGSNNPDIFEIEWEKRRA
jgi:hypothetical protein